jgi:hypothetical protein
MLKMRQSAVTASSGSSAPCTAAPLAGGSRWWVLMDWMWSGRVEAEIPDE